MSLLGNSIIPFFAFWNGNPTNVLMSELNIPQGTVVVDYITPAFWQKTSTTDNSTFNQLTVGASGALTPTSVITTGALKTSSATAGFGFATGAGGAVTQASSITTGVTLSKESGQITTVSSTLAAATSAVFTVTNTLVAATDTIIASVGTYAGAGTPVAWIKNVQSGSYDVVLFNAHASAALNAAVVVNVALIKAVAA